MKTVIISPDGHFYKTNLHCHSTYSDGRKTPEELKNLYRQAGYAVLAISDHNVMRDYSALSDKDFLVMTASELDVYDNGGPGARNRCFHFNVYPRHAADVALPCYNPINVRHGDVEKNRAEQTYIGTPDYQRSYAKAGEMIKTFADMGFLVMVNHFTWSMQTAADYLDVDGFFAMEMYNHGCYVGGLSEINSHDFDTLLRAGKHIYCTATDDNHNKHKEGTAACDSLGGFVVVQAEALTQEAMYDALKAGKFFASTGPMIYEMTMDEEKQQLYVRTDPAVRIAVTCGTRHARVVRPINPAGTVTEATFDTSRFYPGYCRVTVTDAAGHYAWSQPYWSDFAGRKD